MASAPLLASVVPDDGDAPLLASVVPDDGDVIYLPIYPKSMSVPDDSKRDFIMRSPEQLKKFFYPVYSSRLPVSYAQYLACIEELNRFMDAAQDKVQAQMNQAYNGFCTKVAKYSFMIAFFLAITTFSQLACRSVMSRVALLSFIATFACAFFLVCCFCRAMCSGKDFSHQDMFYDLEAPMYLQLKDKLAELGDKYNLTFDLLSTAHVVDKDGPGRPFITHEEALQRKVAYDAQHNIIDGRPRRPIFMHCVALRPQQAPFADPPPLPPPWRAACSSNLTIADTANQLIYPPNSNDSTVNTCVETLNADIKKRYFRGIPMMCALAIAWLGGGIAVGTGAIPYAMGIGCVFGSSSPSSPSSSSTQPDDSFFIHWLVYFGTVYACFGVFAMFASRLQAKDGMAELLDKVSDLNRSRSVQINPCMEVGFRTNQQSDGGNRTARVIPEVTFYLE